MTTEATQKNLKEVVIYTDGGSVPNPGRGGYGVVLRFGHHSKELSGGFQFTTNNRMELMAVIVGLEALKECCRAKLYSDSKYIVDAMTKGSAFRWRENDWRIKSAANSKRCKNPDLWERLLAAYDRHEVEFNWVKGHVGIADNERCDQLAGDVMKRSDLPPDTGYQTTKATSMKNPEFVSANTQTNSNTKMTEVGQPCRKCQTPVVKRVPKKKTVKPTQTYYYAWYLFCPGCRSMYMIEDAKREVSRDDDATRTR